MLWREGNGVASEAELVARALGYRADRAIGVEPDPTVGCIIVRNLFFASRGDEWQQPPNWASNIVSGMGYDLNDPGRRTDTDYVRPPSQPCQARPRVIDFAWEPDLISVVGLAKVLGTARLFWCAHG